MSRDIQELHELNFVNRTFVAKGCEMVTFDIELPQFR